MGMSFRKATIFAAVMLALFLAALGGFTDLEQLLDIEKLGEGVLRGIEDLITIGEGNEDTGS